MPIVPAQLMLYFTVYSILGWVCECIYCSVPAKKFVNRGFLSGPYCPIYGFGALIVIGVLAPLGYNAAAIFFGGMILASILEYCSGFLLEQIFHMQWWDYSTCPFKHSWPRLFVEFHVVRFIVRIAFIWRPPAGAKMARGPKRPATNCCRNPMRQHPPC